MRAKRPYGLTRVGAAIREAGNTEALPTFDSAELVAALLYALVHHAELGRSLGLGRQRRHHGVTPRVRGGSRGSSTVDVMGRRLSASETIAALEHLGFPAIRAATLRRWRHLGWLSPGRGYEPAEVAAVYRRRVAREAA